MKIIDVDKLIDSPRKNSPVQSKPTFSVWWISLVLLFLYFLFRYADCFSLNQATILGIVGSTAIALLVLYITFSNEKRADYRSARKSAKILSEILGSVYNQIERIKNGSKHPIDYPENWLEYYANCSIYLKYDYLEYLLLEFDIIKKINYCISNGNENGLENLLKYREKSMTDWTRDFEIITVKYSLTCFASGFKEATPWKQEKRHIEFADFFRDNYSAKVKELTIAYLREHGRTCEVDDAQYYVLAELRKEAALNTGIHKYVAMENKAVLNAIFKVYLSLKTEDKIELCWGELSLIE